MFRSEVEELLGLAGTLFMAGTQTMNDTPPEIARMVYDGLMERSGAERFRMGVEMFEAARRMVLASLPAGLPESERKRLLFERIYGVPAPSGIDFNSKSEN